jgi:hypothetical protein
LTSFFRDDDDTVPAVEKYKDESFDTSAPKTLKELQEYAESNLETGDLLIMDCTHRFGKIAQLFSALSGIMSPCSFDCQPMMPILNGTHSESTHAH